MLTFNFSPFPNLSTKRLSLRAHTLADAQDLFEIRNDERVRPFLSRPKQTFAEVEKLTKEIIANVESNTGIVWAIYQLDHSKLLGNIGLWRILPEHHRAELGYILRPEHWGQGIMSEAMGRVLEYGFGTMNLHSIMATVNADNAGSIRVLEKHGFVREAYFREDYFFAGKFLDSAVYGLLQSDFRASHA